MLSAYSCEGSCRLGSDTEPPAFPFKPACAGPLQDGATLTLFLPHISIFA